MERWFYFVNVFWVLVVKTFCLELTVLHNGYMAAKYDEIDDNNQYCEGSKECMGGIWRIRAVVEEHRQLEQAGKLPSVIYIIDGSVLAGSPWGYFFKDEIACAAINLLKPDALNFGNHDFDFGKEIFVKFASGLSVPLVTINMDLSRDVDIAPLFKSHIVVKQGVSIAIVGVLDARTPWFNIMDSIGVFDELKSLNAECAMLHSRGIKIIIVASSAHHTISKKIAKESPHVDVVVTHGRTFFQYNGRPPTKDIPVDPYPKIYVQASGRRVPVASSYAYNKYLGRLNLTFSDDGILTHFQGQPIWMSNKISEDKATVQLFDKYRTRYNIFYNTKVGTTRVLLQGDSDSCLKNECNFGNLVADAIVDYFRQRIKPPPKHWATVAVGFAAARTLRFQLDPTRSDGNVTLGPLISMLPFTMSFCLIAVKGSVITEMLENSVSDTNLEQFLQVSGLYVTFDYKAKEFHRVVAVKIRCADCLVPQYFEMEKHKSYNIVVPDPLVNGAYGYTMLMKYAPDKVVYEDCDLLAAIEYIKKYSPLLTGVDGRQRVIYPPVSDKISTYVPSAGILLLLVNFVNYIK